jgi:hypothetical protein
MEGRRTKDRFAGFEYSKGRQLSIVREDRRDAGSWEPFWS